MTGQVHESSVGVHQTDRQCCSTVSAHKLQQNGQLLVGWCMMQCVPAWVEHCEWIWEGQGEVEREGLDLGHLLTCLRPAGAVISWPTAATAVVSILCRPHLQCSTRQCSHASMLASPSKNHHGQKMQKSMLIASDYFSTLSHVYKTRQQAMDKPLCRMLG